MHQMLYQLGRNAHSTVLVIEFVIDMSRLREEAVEHGIRLVMNDATPTKRRQTLVCQAHAQYTIRCIDLL